MARLRLLWPAVLAALIICTSLLAAPALGASARRHHAARCHAVHRGHAGSVRTSHHPSGARRRARCRRHTRRHRLSGHSRRPGTPSHSVQANASGCQDGDLKPSSEDLERIRLATLCLVNRERTSRGENALRLDAHLAQAAQGHSDSMAGGDYFDHTGPGGQTPLDRMRAAGYVYSSQIGYDIGENIAWGTGSLSTPRAIVAAWMASPGHRANILDPHYRDTAVGVSAQAPRSLAHGQPGGIYTQDFGRIITA